MKSEAEIRKYQRMLQLMVRHWAKVWRLANALG